MRRYVFLLTLLIVFIGCPAAPKNSARIYIQQQDYVGAKEQIYLGLKETPDDYELYTLLMKAEVGLGNWVDASKAFKDALRRDSLKTIDWLLSDKDNIPVYWQALYNAAIAQQAEKNYEGALENLRYTKIIDPSNVSQYILEGGIYSELGQKDKASDAYTQALNIDPENPEAYFLIGKAMFESSMFDSALVKFNEAVNYFTIKYDRYVKVLFQNLPAFDRALAREITTLWKEKKENELDELVKVQLGFDAGLAAQKRNIETFFKITDGLSRSYYYRGMTYYNLQKDSLALQNLIKSLDYMPDDLDALFYTGELLVRFKNYREAIPYFERITQIEEEDVLAWFYLGVCYSQLKDYKAAIQIYEDKVLALDPKNINAYTNLAFAYRELGNNKKALEYLMKAEELQKE
jgi:tetratricopeptide (TPR) repeat protein